MKQTSTFIQALDKIDDGIKQMKEHIALVRWFYDIENMEQTYEKAMKLEEVSEKTVLLTRALPAYTGRPTAEADVDNLIAQNIQMEIGFTVEGWFSLRIPALLPKKGTGSTDYVRSFLYPAMKAFFDGKPPIRYKDCVLVFRHVYDRSRPERQMRDHDNIEVNMVSDIVAMYVMPDDSPSVCSHYYCSADSSEDRTEVYVVPKHDFPIWFIEEKAMPEKGVILFDTIQICP